MPNPLIPLPEDARAPQEVRFVNLAVDPHPDGRRVKVRVELTPFQQDPSLDIVIQDDQGAEISRVYIIETLETHLLFTMHLKTIPSSTHLVLQARIYYQDLGTIEERGLAFEINALDQ